MLLEVTKVSKSLGVKDLFQDLSFTVAENEKIALIGRNGQGKTTLLKILSGEDHDHDGTVWRQKDMRITLTKQEHHGDTHVTVLNYILGDVPHYLHHKEILDAYERGESENIDQYSDSIEYFVAHDYYNLEPRILQTLADFQVDPACANLPLTTLSGGEKRYVEMVRMMYSQAQLLLIDEPTNHMDYVGKERFISWMNSLRASIIVVTHDRDVLKHVDKIWELKDKKITSNAGNYDDYIKRNTLETTNSVKQYSDQLNRLKEAKKRVEWGLQMRAKSKEWKIRYDHWFRDYEKLKAETVKPSFWIDQESVEGMDKDVVDSYHKFKEKNITISTHADKERVSHLLTIRNLSLGYGEPLFRGKSFTLRSSERLFIKGRNGAGKSTLVRTIMAISRGQIPAAALFAGEIIPSKILRIGEYEQEIGQKYLDMTLMQAVEHAYREIGTGIEYKDVMSLLSQYLFDPRVDGGQKVAHLSGGQKARFQLIKMFINKPNLLILDEPTNHLDLPSIEELENALSSFHGGIIYISHDTYFISHMGGEVLEI